ncbi:MAG: flagellar basal body P-ring protein FlgI, partial [Nevskia sp.]|uniref:flagellar basal body P-ring protein FlgI n=1 Tax=Nevskia sp. TaxID=1929292 RepID=UPI00403714EA
MALGAALLALALPAQAQAPGAPARPLHSLVDVEGMRENQLIGYGLVVGLQGSGDSSQIRFSGQTVENMLKQFGVKLPERSNTKARNVATVMV